MIWLVTTNANISKSKKMVAKLSFIMTFSSQVLQNSQHCINRVDTCSSYVKVRRIISSKCDSIFMMPRIIVSPFLLFGRESLLIDNMLSASECCLAEEILHFCSSYIFFFILFKCCRFAIFVGRNIRWDCIFSLTDINYF